LSECSLAYFGFEAGVGIQQGGGVLANLFFEKFLVGDLIVNVDAGTEPVSGK